MATANEFIEHIARVDGVAGCLLVRSSGQLLGQMTIDAAEDYATLMALCSNLSAGVMESVGFSYCRHICFTRSDQNHFYVFPIDKFLLGVTQNSDCYVPDMLEAIYRLIGRVSTRRATDSHKED